MSHSYHSSAIPTGLLPFLEKPSVHTIEEAGVTRCAQFLPLPSLPFPKPTRGLCMMCKGKKSWFLLQRQFPPWETFFFGKLMSSPFDATASRWHLIILRTKPRLLAVASRSDPVQPGPGYSNPHLAHTPTLQPMLFLLCCLLIIPRTHQHHAYLRTFTHDGPTPSFRYKSFSQLSILLPQSPFSTPIQTSTSAMFLHSVLSLCLSFNIL